MPRQRYSRSQNKGFLKKLEFLKMLLKLHFAFPFLDLFNFPLSSMRRSKGTNRAATNTAFTVLYPEISLSAHLLCSGNSILFYFLILRVTLHTTA